MKTIKHLLFFGGFMLFFNFSHAAVVTNVNTATLATNADQLRQSIHATFNNTFSGSINEPEESLIIDFVVGPDNHLQITEISGGTPALKKLVKDKFATIQASNNLVNERYTIQLTFNLI